MSDPNVLTKIIYLDVWVYYYLRNQIILVVANLFIASHQHQSLEEGA